MKTIQRIIDVTVAVYLAILLGYSALFGVKITDISYLDYQWWLLFIVVRLFTWMIQCCYGEDDKSKT